MYSRLLFSYTLYLFYTSNISHSQVGKKRIHTSSDGSVREWQPDTQEWSLIRTATPIVASGKQLLLKGQEFNFNFTAGEFSVRGKPIIVHPAPVIRDTKKQQDGDTGRFVWDGSIVLAKYLEHVWSPESSVCPINSSNCNSITGKNVLELGAGTGLSGIAAALLGAASVTLTDLPYCLETLNRNASEALKRNSSASQMANIHVEALDWFTPNDLKVYDIILGADVVWLADLVKPLTNVLIQLTDINPDAVILLAHQTRSNETDEILFNALRKYFRWNISGENVHPDFSIDKIKVFKLHRK
eukprot:GSMAST32.ASY1.ANO1.507.1 assembled CDS